MSRIALGRDAASYQKAVFDIRLSATSSFVLYYAIVVGFCALVRCLVLNRIRDSPLRPRLLEAITCMEQYACWLGHMRVEAAFGSDMALAALTGSSVYRWMTQCPGTTANPFSYMLAFVVGQCCMSVEEMSSRIAIQVALIIWFIYRVSQNISRCIHCYESSTLALCFDRKSSLIDRLLSFGHNLFSKRVNVDLYSAIP